MSPSEQELWRRVEEEESRRLDGWEQPVEADSASGKLDHLLSELNGDIAAARVKPLREIIDEP